MPDMRKIPEVEAAEEEPVAPLEKLDGLSGFDQEIAQIENFVETEKV